MLLLIRREGMAGAVPDAREATALAAKQVERRQLGARDDHCRGLRRARARHEMLEPLRNIGRSVSSLLRQPPKSAPSLTPRSGTEISTACPEEKHRRGRH